MIRRLAYAFLALVTLAGGAQASTSPPISVKLAGITAPARDGQPYQFDVIVSSRSTVTLSGFSLSGAFQRDGVVHDAPTMPVILSGRVSSRTLHVTLTPNGPRPGLELRFLVNGVAVTREFDFSAEGLDRVTRPGALASVPADVVIPESPPLLRSVEGLKPLERETRFGPDKPKRAAPPAGSDNTATGVVTVRGRLVYLRDDGQTLAVDGATVRVYDEDWDWDEHLGTTMTLTDGRYSVDVYASEGAPDLYLEFELANSRVVLEDDALEFNYILTSGVKEDFGGSTADFGTLQPNNAIGRGACHILTNVTRGWRELAGIGWDVPSVDIQYPSSDWPNYDGSEIHIPRVVEDTDFSWAGGTHLHEYGHHVMASFFYTPDFSYDNGVCNHPNGDPGHCTWCEEDDGTAINEGFADWLSDLLCRRHESDYGVAVRRARDRENTNGCSEGAGWGNEPQIIEGYFAALLRDIDDSTNEDDTGSDEGEDQLSLGADEILDTMDSGDFQGPNGFINRFVERYPSLSRTQVWATFRNNTFDLDEAAPGVSPYLESTSHNEGANFPASTDFSIDVAWQPATDDWSGAAEYSLAIGTSPTMPDTYAEITEGMDREWTGMAEDPGYWYITLRARDRSGRWSNSYATAGPYRIRDRFPADLTYGLFPPAGWDGNLVLRGNSSATTGSAASSLILDSDGNCWWNAAVTNYGELNANSSRMRFLIDGVKRDSVNTSAVGPNGTGFVMNQGAIVVKGGRHTAEVWADAAETTAESSELNNHASRQYVWDPDPLEAYTLHTLAAPPLRTAGHASLPIGTTPWDNCDGFEIRHLYTPPGGTISGTATWMGVLAYTVSQSPTVGVDLKVFSSSTNSSGGFALPRATSLRPSGSLDAMFTNRAVNDDGTWDLGVFRSGQLAGTYRLQQVVPRTIDVDDSLEVEFGNGEMMTLRTFIADASELGTYLVEVRGADAVNNNITTLWYRSDVEVAGIDDYDGKATSDLQGRSTLKMVVDEPGTYLIVAYRNPGYATPSTDFGLKLRLAQPDVRPYTSSQWSAPLVPRRTADAYPGPASATPTLAGDGTTYMNLSVRNTGSVPADRVETDVMWDGVARTGTTFLDVINGTTRTMYDTAPTTIPGGLHTLWLSVDPDDELAESDEEDNLSGRQWVFEPPVRSLAAPQWRKHGRAIDVGWSTLPEDAVVQFNQDALRTPSFTSGMGHAWAAVALMPTSNSDMDLWLHEKSTGSTDGFDSPLTTSDWGARVLDYVLVDFSSTAHRGFDAGMVRVEAPGAKDTAQYVSEVVGATRLTNPLAGTGSVNMGYGRLAHVYTLPLTYGRWTIRLSNGFGSTTDWGLALHVPGQPFQNRTDGLASWANGDGGSEAVVLNVDQPGDYALVVFKSDSDDIPKSGNYSVTITQSTLDADPSAPALSTGLRSAAPDPFVNDVRFGIELAEPSELRLEVHDVTGARRRVLAQGAWSAGRHSVQWDGRDDGGRAVPPGLYLVRMVAGGKVSTAKVVRTR